jgi:aminotransferase in exopolysaccharide biosynthesis
MKEIPLSVPYLNGNEWEYIKECLDTNWVSSAGKYVDQFEEELADYVGSEYAVATVNGTAAIHTALKILGVERGDKVIVPALTFIASVNPINYCGAEAIFVDSEMDTYNLDPVKLENKIVELIEKNQKPKAVIVVHLYGQPAKIKEITEICNKYEIYLIEDATESLGSKYKGQMTGTFGDIGCFSFNGNKLITTGGGGMLVTDNKEWAEKAKYLTTQAKDDPVQFVHNEIGYNYRLTNIQAALGVAQLEQIEEFIKKKRAINDFYFNHLNSIEGIKVTKELDNSYSNYWLSTILVNEAEFGINSKKLYKKLRENGIMVRPFFKPISELPMYDKNDFEGQSSQKLWGEGICLPSSVSLDESDLKRIVESIKQNKS